MWSPASDIVSPDTSNTPNTRVYPKSYGQHVYTLEVDDNYGCNFKVVDKVAVTMNPPVPAFAGRDTIAAMDLPHQLFGSGGVSYLWSPGFLLDNPTKKNPIAMLRSDTRFALMVTDNGGCVGYDTVFVKVYVGPTYYIPNAFSPNGDGINDVFRAIPPGITKTEYFRVFNRWGQMIFETHDYMKGWDGTYIGKPQPTGAYVWIIKGVDKYGKTVQMRGTVILVR
jgi:gliding motility-associated-like protein